MAHSDWSNDLDDFDAADWEDYLGGPDDLSSAEEEEEMQRRAEEEMQWRAEEDD